MGREPLSVGRRIRAIFEDGRRGECAETGIIFDGPAGSRRVRALVARDHVHRTKSSLVPLNDPPKTCSLRENVFQRSGDI